MSRIRPIDVRKCRTSFSNEYIVQFGRREKVSLLLLSVVLTGHFPVHFKPKVALQVTIGVGQFLSKNCFNYCFNKKYSFSFYFILSNEISIFISF